MDASPKSRDARDIRARLAVEPVAVPTLVFVLAVHREASRNTLTRIPCRKALPIGGYVYEPQTDACFVDCYDYLPLGEVPVSFRQSMPGAGNWACRVPMPEPVLRRHLSGQQRKDLRGFKRTYGGDYTHQFMQMIGCC